MLAKGTRGQQRDTSPGPLAEPRGSAAQSRPSRGAPLLLLLLLPRRPQPPPQGPAPAQMAGGGRAERSPEAPAPPLPLRPRQPSSAAHHLPGGFRGAAFRSGPGLAPPCHQPPACELPDGHPGRARGEQASGSGRAADSSVAPATKAPSARKRRRRRRRGGGDVSASSLVRGNSASWRGGKREREREGETQEGWVACCRGAWEL